MATTEIDLALSWSNGFKGSGLITGQNFAVPIGIPTVYGGSGEGANPKELLASSAAACFIATLTAILETNKVPVRNLAVSTHVVEADSAFSIAHTVQLVLANKPAADEVAAIEALVARADKVCTVGNILRKSGVEIEARLGSVE
ncbi:MULTISPECIES: OsmC family protein [Pseudomonas]|uniref:OsmC family protein n=1 Tax=Pseudomonas TaxID=286 RepID=UPI001E5882C2|nr:MULTISPECIES: OsmC family protein [Pseudomonas]EKT4502756.1 OsmC family protein [Pseudomonas putida]MCK1156637.1 OsmC family protein [Pseudomonas aeruginosa]MDM3893864.1 OsmC family protein [Pseudomonas juntendi]